VTSSLARDPRLSGSDGLGQRDEQGIERLPDLHVPRLAYFGGSWFRACTCGYVSTGCLTEREAIETPCEVEVVLAESWLRRQRLGLLEGQGQLGR